MPRRRPRPANVTNVTWYSTSRQSRPPRPLWNHAIRASRIVYFSNIRKGITKEFSAILKRYERHAATHASQGDIFWLICTSASTPIPRSHEKTKP